VSQAPRNRDAYERSQAVRAEIHAILERHPATAKPLTAKHIRTLLALPISERTVRWHMQRIRCHHGNSSYELAESI
jgi:hypothetical protein